MKMCTIAIIGASGVCGREAIKIFNEQPDIYINSLQLFASYKSVGEKVIFREKVLYIQEYTEDVKLSEFDFIMLFTPSSLSKSIVNKCKNLNNSPVIIDNSSAFRMDQNIPLVIPEITPKKKYSGSKVISNPNCSTIILLNGLYYLINKKNKILSVDVTTFQAVSGAGKSGLDELQNQLETFKTFKTDPDKMEINKFGRQILCNVIPHESEIDPKSGYNQEEIKIIKETEKILELNNFPIDVECNRAGIERCHLEIVKVRFENDIEFKNLDEFIKNTWGNAKGVKIVSSLEDKNKFMDPLSASSTNDVYISRIRISHNDRKCLKFRLIGDQIRVGASWNAIKIFKSLTVDNILK